MFPIIYILWLRQIKRYIRSRSRIVGSLGQPLLFLLALGFGFGPTFEKAGGGDYFQFLVSGVVAMSILFTAMFSGIEIIWDRQFGFLKETLVAPVSRLTIMVGRTLGGATVATLQGCIVLVLAVIFGFRTELTLTLLLAPVFMFLIALLFTALGTAVACKLEDMQGFQLIMNFLIMPLFFLSGALFPLDSAPVALIWIARFDPLSYGVDGLRGALIGASHFGIAADFGILIVVTAVLLWIGSVLFKSIEA
ncbi:MAG: ABC transporter permease [Candidatus Peribacteraceae bacterium]|nr:ABC transporter permease [Candidatus Peribacteraceae bacterium]